MIIVEGPDGSGKTSLIKRLIGEFDFDLPLGPKASTSMGGTSQFLGNDLPDWVDAEMDHWGDLNYGPRFYDRHPLISESIYGPIIRNRLPPKFTTPWYGSRLKMMRKMTLVVWVDPGWVDVRAGLRAEPQMDGVIDRSHQLWLTYRMMALGWAGSNTVYNRNDPKSILRLVGLIDAHIDRWRF